MKKMVCEICGSQSIRKENGVFVCAECGTEYSLEEARKLLVEVEDSSLAHPKSESKPTTDLKPSLIDQIYAWVKYLQPYFELSKYIKIDTTKLECYMTPIDLDRIKSGELIKIDAFDYMFDEYKLLFLKNDFDKHGPIFTYINDIAYHFITYYNGGIGEYKEYERFKGVLPHSYEVRNEDNFCKYFNKFYPSSDSPINREDYYPYCGIKFHTRAIFGKTVKEFTAHQFFTQIHFLKKMIVKSFNDFLVSSISPIAVEIAKVINDLQLDNEKMEKMLFLPYKYRNELSLTSLAQLVIDGRCSSWEDCMNLYETEEFRKTALTRLEGIEDKMGYIANKMDSMSHTLIDISNTLSSSLSLINTQLMQIRESTNKISMNTFISAWHDV